MYIIGFYNEKIDDKENLNMCNIVFSDFEKMKRHLRNNDTVLLASDLSLFYVDIKEILQTKEEFNLDIVTVKDKDECKSYKNLKLTTMLGINEYVKDEHEKIYRLINELE